MDQHLLLHFQQLVPIYNIHKIHHDDDYLLVMNETNSSVTFDNELQNMMDKDDPFADDFNKEMEDIN